MKKKYNRATYEELSDDLSQYEISCLASFKALDMIKSGKSLIGNDPYKPKVAFVALNELCSDRDSTLAYKKEIEDRLFNSSDIEIEDEYNIDFESFSSAGVDADEKVDTEIDTDSNVLE